MPHTIAIDPNDPTLIDVARKAVAAALQARLQDAKVGTVRVQRSGKRDRIFVFKRVPASLSPIGFTDWACRQSPVLYELLRAGWEIVSTSTDLFATDQSWVEAS